jgi:hypothetical protein
VLNILPKECLWVLPFDRGVYKQFEIRANIVTINGTLVVGKLLSALVKLILGNFSGKLEFNLKFIL